MDKGKKREVFSKNVRLIISIIVLLIMLVAATVAWYVLSNSAKINSFSNKFSQWDFIVSKTPNGDPISKDETFELNIKEFENVEDNKMAPGTYGYISLFIRASSMVTGYAISIDESELTFKVPSSVNLNEEGIQLTNSNLDGSTIDCTELLSKHFKFYIDEACTTEITKDKPFVDKLQPNQEEVVKIYWKWLYDGSKAAANITDEEKKEDFMTKWDNEDNFLLKYKEYLNGSVKVTACGTQEDPSSTNASEGN